MGHHWEPNKTTGGHPLAAPGRRCACCGVVQRREGSRSWRSITGPQWRPLAPKCEAPGLDPKRRHLWTRSAETPDGNRLLAEARALSFRLENRHLTDAQLIRLAYWGTPGDA